MGKISVRVSDSFEEFLRRRAQEEGVRMTDLVKTALNRTYAGKVAPLSRDEVMSLVEDLDKRLSRLEEMANG